MRGTLIAALAVAFSAAVMCGSPVAAADNDSYLAAVSSLHSAEGDDGLLKVGKGACGLLAPTNSLMFGRSPNLVARMVWEGNPRLERPQAALLVNAAIDNLCPGVNPLGYANPDG